MARKRATGGSSEKPKKKSGNKQSRAKRILAARSAAAAAAAAKPDDNPFETIWSRRKFNVIGLKRKGEERRVGLARSRAVDKRRKTLLPEYEQSGKSSVFVDKRIGEKNEGLEEFDKAIMRFQRERQMKVNRKSKYNLSDGEEEELEPNDDFEDDVSLEDEEEDGHVAKGDFLSFDEAGPTHSGADLENVVERGNKTKREVMKEVMLKDKYFKALKAKEKEEDEQKLEQYDGLFASIAQSGTLSSINIHSTMNALEALQNKTKVEKELSNFVNGDSSKKEQPDSYDLFVKGMVLDMRSGRPADRTKTPDEIAQDEKEELERLEEERKKRMLGDDDSSEDDSDGSGVRESSPHSRAISGDDLGDFSPASERLSNKEGWVDKILEAEALDDEGVTTSGDSENGEEEDGHGEENDDSGDDDQLEENDADADEFSNRLSTRDWEQSDEEDINTELKEEDGGEKLLDNKGLEMGKNVKGLHVDNINKQKENTPPKQPSMVEKALPYVIDAPESLEELSLLLNNRSDDEVVEAVCRIRKCNAIRLSAENRKKMQVFYGVLLQYFAVTASKKPLNLKLINMLLKPLVEMSEDCPYFAAICARQRLVKMRSQLCEDIKSPGKSSWPSVKTLLLLKLFTMIFPCSDFRHPVMTPATLLMHEYLMRCPISSGRDIAIGTFLCSMVLMVTGQSRKFCAEGLLFLQSLLISAIEGKDAWHHNPMFYHLTDLKVHKPWLWIRNSVTDIRPLDFLAITEMPADSSFFESDSFRASILILVMELLKGFTNIYAGFSSFSEIFSPILLLLRKILEVDNYPKLLIANTREAIQLIEKQVKEHHMLRQPLQMHKKKPMPIKLLTPKFEENFVKGRDYDPDRERAERKKLRKRLKQEAKGAARELRKDNAFLFDLKEKDRSILEEERAEKYGKARAFLQEQEHAFKSGQLGKGRKRRR